MFELVRKPGDSEAGEVQKPFHSLLALCMRQVIHMGMLCYMDGPPDLGFVVAHGSLDQPSEMLLIAAAQKQPPPQKKKARSLAELKRYLPDLPELAAC